MDLLPPDHANTSPAQVALAANRQRRQREAILSSLPATVSRVLEEASCVYSPELEQFIRSALPSERDEQTEVDVDRLTKVLEGCVPTAGSTMLWLGSGPVFKVNALWARAKLRYWLDMAEDLILASVDGNQGVFASASSASPEDEHPNGCSGTEWDYAIWPRDAAF